MNRPEPGHNDDSTPGQPSATDSIPLLSDPDVFEGVMTIAFVLPYKVPSIVGLNPIVIDEAYLRVRVSPMQT